MASISTSTAVEDEITESTTSANIATTPAPQDGNEDEIEYDITDDTTSATITTTPAPQVISGKYTSTHRHTVRET
jgi:hypothetical protein